MTDVNEEWRPVVGYEGLYEVSDQGRVRSVDRYVRSKGNSVQLRRGRVLKPRPQPADGRRQVNLSREGRPNWRAVYVLVLEAFVSPRPSGMEGCHNNGDASDDRLVNLRWDTRSENQRDVVRHGKHPEANRTRCPQGHALAVPNLVPSSLKEGKRQCLACNRAGAYDRLWRRRGVHYDRKALADDHYARIMQPTG